MPVIQGDATNTSQPIGIIVSRFNEYITASLLEGALSWLREHGQPDPLVVWVPGALELPYMAKKMASSGKVAGIICLGCVIRGETTHYDVVCEESARGVTMVSLETSIPIAFGVLTTETTEQAEARAGLKGGANKGVDVAQCICEMLSIQI